MSSFVLKSAKRKGSTWLCYRLLFLQFVGQCNVQLWKLVLIQKLFNMEVCISTLRSILSILFYQTSWFEIFYKVSNKRPVPSQKNLIVLFYSFTYLDFYFYQTSWFEMFSKISNKWPVPSQKDLIVLFLHLIP